MSEPVTIRSGLMEALTIQALLDGRDVDELANEAIAIYLHERQRRKIEHEIEVYVDMHEELWEKLPWQWVAIHNGQLVDQDGDEGALYRRVRQTYGRIAVLIRQVRAEVEDVIWWHDLSMSKLKERIADRELEREAIIAYEEWKRDPSTAQPWEEFEAELIQEGLLDVPDGEQAASPEEILEMAGSVYDGLAEEEIDAIEAAILSDDHPT